MPLLERLELAPPRDHSAGGGRQPDLEATVCREAFSASRDKQRARWCRGDQRDSIRQTFNDPHSRQEPRHDTRTAGRQQVGSGRIGQADQSVESAHHPR